MVRESADPVYVTKNGYDDMVIMTMEAYDSMVRENGRLRLELDWLAKLMEGERAIARGEVVDSDESVERIWSRYGL
jgi:PHD/YefM family antitoxin component YafN of YafNO toxin-antitoxin module